MKYLAITKLLYYDKKSYYQIYYAFTKTERKEFRDALSRRNLIDTIFVLFKYLIPDHKKKRKFDLT